MWVTESVAGRLQLARVSLRGYARTIRDLYRNRVGVARLSFFRWPIGFGYKHVPGFDMIKLAPDGTVAAGTFADPAISGKRGPCLGDAPNSKFLGGQRNSEFEQGSGEVHSQPAEIGRAAGWEEVGQYG